MADAKTPKKTAKGKPADAPTPEVSAEATPKPKQKADEVGRVGQGEPVISARRISLWYGDVIGINNISLDICSGVIGLLGPNGAGKSTLFKCLSGQLQPQTGAVTIHKMAVWNNAPVFSRIGLVPEQDAFYEDMSGLGFVAYLTRLQGYGADDAEALAREAIASVSMTERQDDKIRTYSKGMRQRVKIAQALAHRPDVYFMDEPLTGTDPLGRRQIIELIQQLGDAGKTVLVSSHVLHEVEQMTSEIVMINRGRIVANGDVYQIREMIDEHPHTLIIGCDKPRALASLLAPFEDIVRMELFEQELRVATRDPDACYTRIPALMLEHDITLHRLNSPDNNLMAVFRYLVG